MPNMARKQVMGGITTGCLTSCISPGLNAFTTAAPAADGHPLIPPPAKPWNEATRLVGERPQRSLAEVSGKLPNFQRLPLYNDFTLVSDLAGRWHCIEILFEGTSAEAFRQDRLFHYVADSIQAPYYSVGYVDLGYGKVSDMWAPFILRAQNRTLMFYARLADHGISVRVAETIDPELRSWRRRLNGLEIIVQEPNASDPDVIHDEFRDIYILYYIASVQRDTAPKDVVWFRTYVPGANHTFRWMFRRAMGPPNRCLFSSAIGITTCGLVATTIHACHFIYPRILSISVTPPKTG